MTDLTAAVKAAALDAAWKTREYRAGALFGVPNDAVESFTLSVLRAAAPILRAQVLAEAREALLPLHRPVRDAGDDIDWCHACTTAWPCATAEAIDALGAEGAR